MLLQYYILLANLPLLCADAKKPTWRDLRGYNGKVPYNIITKFKYLNNANNKAKRFQ